MNSYLAYQRVYIDIFVVQFYELIFSLSVKYNLFLRFRFRYYNIVVMVSLRCLYNINKHRHATFLIWRVTCELVKFEWKCFPWLYVCSRCSIEHARQFLEAAIFRSRPSDHYFRSVCWFVCLSVCLFVWLCRVFLSRL